MVHVHQNQESDALEFVEQKLRNERILEFDDPDIRWSAAERMPGRTSDQAGKMARWDRHVSFGQRTRRGVSIAAVAAAVFAILGAFAGSWLDPSAKAFAEMQEAIKSARSAVFTLQTFSADQLIQRSRISYRVPDLARMESGLSLRILNGQSKEYLSVSHKDRTASIEPVYHVEAFRTSLFDTLQQLSTMRPVEGTKLQRVTVEGKSFLEFKAVFDGDIATVRVDEASMLPIHVDVERGVVDGAPIHEVLSNFSFDDTLNDELFSIRVPDGYTENRIARVEIDSAESYVVTSGTGMGPVRFGMGQSAVMNLLGEPEAFESNPAMVPELDESGKPRIIPGQGFKMIPADPAHDVAILSYPSRGFRLSISSLDGVVGIYCFDAQVNGPSSRSFRGRTAEGIKIGTPIEEAKRLLPGAKLVGDALMCPGMRIQFVNGLCRQISIASVPE